MDAAAAGEMNPPPPVPVAEPRQPGYTVLFAGRRAGKTALIRLLLDSLDIAESATAAQTLDVAEFMADASQRTTALRSVSIDVVVPEITSVATDHDVKPPRTVTLTLIDTPALEFTDTTVAGTQLIADFVDARWKRSIDDSCPDHQPHLCIYVLDPDDVLLRPPIKEQSDAAARPDGLHMRELEVKAIHWLAGSVNVLPVIGRCDTLIRHRMVSIKKAIVADLLSMNVNFGIFCDTVIHSRATERLAAFTREHPAECHPEDLKRIIHITEANFPEDSPLLPYALTTPDIYIWDDGTKHFNSHVGLPAANLARLYNPDTQIATKMAPGRFVRRFAWGTLDITDKVDCDFPVFREALFCHMQELKTHTNAAMRLQWKVEIAEQPAPRGSAFMRVAASTASISVSTSISPSAGSTATAPEIARSGLPAALITAISPASATGPGSPLATSPTYPLIPGTSQYNLATGLPGVPKLRQKKILVACNFCRTRKLKCDGGRPACAQCVKRQNHCDYQQVLKRARRDNGIDPGSNGPTNAESSASASGLTEDQVEDPLTQQQQPEPEIAQERPPQQQQQNSPSTLLSPSPDTVGVPGVFASQAFVSSATSASSTTTTASASASDRPQLVVTPPSSFSSHSSSILSPRPTSALSPPSPSKELPLQQQNQQDSDEEMYDDELPTLPPLVTILGDHAPPLQHRGSDRDRVVSAPVFAGERPQLPPISISIPQHHRGDRESFEGYRDARQSQSARDWVLAERDREWDRRSAGGAGMSSSMDMAPYEQQRQGHHAQDHRRTTSLPGVAAMHSPPPPSAYSSRGLPPPAESPRSLYHPQQQSPPYLGGASPPSPPMGMPRSGQSVHAMAAVTGTPPSRRVGSNYGPKTVACNFCRSRKTKCDGGHPKCHNCAKRSLPCEYLEDQRRRRSSTASTSTMTPSTASSEDQPRMAPPGMPSMQYKMAPGVPLDGLVTGDGQRLKKLAPMQMDGYEDPSVGPSGEPPHKRQKVAELPAAW